MNTSLPAVGNQLVTIMGAELEEAVIGPLGAFRPVTVLTVGFRVDLGQSTGCEFRNSFTLVRSRRYLLGRLLWSLRLMHCYEDVVKGCGGLLIGRQVIVTITHEVDPVLVPRVTDVQRAATTGSRQAG